jgi:hypothetical protein
MKSFGKPCARWSVKGCNRCWDVVPRVTGEHWAMKSHLNVHAQTPTTLADCKMGGWTSYSTPTFDPSGALTGVDPMFKNQGDCVSFVATGGK